MMGMHGIAAAAQKWYGPTWAYNPATGIWTNTPILGEELLVNGGFEDGDPPTNWPTDSGVLSRQPDPRPGSAGVYCLQIAKGSSHIYPGAFQEVTLPVSTWCFCLAWLKRGTTGTGPVISYRNRSPSYSEYGQVSTTNTAWTQLRVCGRSTVDNTPAFLLGANNLESDPIGVYSRFDDFSAKVVDFKTTLRTKLFPSATGTVKTRLVNSPYLTPVGVAMGIDSHVNPTYGVFGYHNGNNIKLEYMLNGVWTTSINTTVAFVSNALIEIRKTATTYQLWYNGAQVGTDITISDATLNNSRRHGLFSTYNGNQLKDFSFTPA